MNTIRCAVIGVGYLGRFHAQKYKLLPNAELVGVCDLNEASREAVSHELNVTGYSDFTQLFGQVDAVSIVATTQKHYEIAKACLSAGIHVLIEKPITETLTQANELIKLAHEHKVKLQVGHLERFNPARLAIEPYLNHPSFIDAQRLAPYNPRGADVNVILDLMIHDIDIIQNIVKSPIVSIQAQGTSVVTPAIDIAHARIQFENHCTAHLTASRVSFKMERKMQLIQEDTKLFLDYQNKELTRFHQGDKEVFPGTPELIHVAKEGPHGDALFLEIQAFLSSIQHNTTPIVRGEDARDALATAQRITHLIQEHRVLNHA